MICRIGFANTPPVSRLVAFRYHVIFTRPWRIMGFGDSITHGGSELKMGVLICRPTT